MTRKDCKDRRPIRLKALVVKNRAVARERYGQFEAELKRVLAGRKDANLSRGGAL